MLFCPRCGDYYADGSLAFCLADGTPLMSVNPGSERWSEGARIIEQKENALRKQKRRSKWRRVSSLTTILIVTMIVYGVVAKRYVFLIPAVSPSPTPRIETKQTPTPTIVIKETPTPTIAIKETPTPTIVIEKTPTPTIVIRETPTPKIVIKETPTPTIVIRETPTPKIVIKETPTPTRECSEADRSHAKETILSRYRDTFQRRIEGERNKIITQFSDGPVRAAAELGPVEYESTILNQCTVASVRARYVWRVYLPAKAMTSVPREKRFTCVRIGGAWLCP